ncbi:TetR/AcrR family transcriptional regulator [Thermophilibacter sp. ET337]|uniref:TetR/AcrR family transcriptional regulator n=1 Tax=Thermophilibacter sp. ET337 TaxID=2973084 RepID=UPI0021AC3676|nr:TetR/AcrR family transcriptional regulator [Thermophilibacter sp. ET337]MCR8907607.1 TetR/AcrR family transcriptional regulator [Thermophilibacter sp. ET337]
MAARPGTATPKSAATREKIMAATAELMVERGGTDFQMAEVTSRCGMSKGALYYYFPDKAELVRAVLDRAVEGLVAEVERVVATAPSAGESIQGLMGALCEATRPGGPLMLAMAGAGVGATPVEGLRLERIVDVLEAQLERAKGEGLARPEVNARLAAAAVAGAFLVFERVDVRATAADVLDLALRGVGTDAARELCA